MKIIDFLNRYSLHAAIAAIIISLINIVRQCAE